MKRLLNTLYVTEPDLYLAADGNNIEILKNHERVKRIPLVNLEAIVTFGHQGISPNLLEKCLYNNIPVTFLSMRGNFKGRIIGKQNGNVLLRRKQYRIADDEGAATEIARNFIFGKVYNQRWLLERAIRDHALKIDVPQVKAVSTELNGQLENLLACTDLETLLGLEGNLAKRYFTVFDQLILQDQADFPFHGRNRRPPLDRVNAMLSFAYTLLKNECVTALESNGLDSYVGFFHQDRPGRTSLALDLMEELRGAVAERTVLTMINRQQIKASDFIIKEDGSVLLTDDGRRTFLRNWQERKSVKIVHPYLKEKIEWGLVPFVQAKLLTAYLRGDLDMYPPFLWK